MSEARYCPHCDKTQIRCSDPPACIMGETACSDAQALWNAENHISALLNKVDELEQQLKLADVNHKHLGEAAGALWSYIKTADAFRDKMELLAEMGDLNTGLEMALRLRGFVDQGESGRLQLSAYLQARGATDK